MELDLASRRRLTLSYLLICLSVGIIIGSGFFNSIQPRALLAWRTCLNASCLRPNEVTGLMAAVGIKFAPNQLPLVVRETSYTIAFRDPLAPLEKHYIIVPKKDIKNIGELDATDQVYLTDAFAVMQDLIKTEHLTKYLIRTNGPGYQDVAYLHFHLESE